MSQTLAGTLPSPEVSPGSLGFDSEWLQGEAAQQSWMCFSRKGSDGYGGINRHVGDHRMWWPADPTDSVALQILPLTSRSWHHASAYQVGIREEEPEGPRGAGVCRQMCGQGNLSVGLVSRSLPHSISYGGSEPLQERHPSTGPWRSHWANTEQARTLPLLSAGVCKIPLVRDN